MHLHRRSSKHCCILFSGMGTGTGRLGLFIGNPRATCRSRLVRSGVGVMHIVEGVRGKGHRCCYRLVMRGGPPLGLGTSNATGRGVNANVMNVTV